jgi:dihydrofolate reductase
VHNDKLSRVLLEPLSPMACEDFEVSHQFAIVPSTHEHYPFSLIQQILLMGRKMFGPAPVAPMIL